MDSARPGGAYPLVRLAASLLLMTMGGAAMYAAIMVLEPVAREFGIGHGGASLPYATFMIGFALGGVAIGRVADRLGIMVPAVVGSLSLSAGLALAAHAGTMWQFCLALGVPCALLGASVTFAPLISDVSHWFTARRGLAVGIAISGSYVAGAVWPPVLQHLIDHGGWRAMFSDLSVLTLVTMVPLALVLWRRPPIESHADVHPDRARAWVRPLGLKPNALQCVICVAGVGCCVAMSMPQVHIVPYVIDLGYPAARGAEMLSLMLGCGIVSRVASGWLSDRIGGLATLLLGSTLQASTIAIFLLAHSLPALYAASVAFGLAQGGIVPSYAIIIRTFFPAEEAGWRIGLALLFTISGMALGGWMAGALYDLTGSYTVSFLNAIAFNLANMAIVAGLRLRARRAVALAAAA